MWGGDVGCIKKKKRNKKIEIGYFPKAGYVQLYWLILQRAVYF